MRRSKSIELLLSVVLLLCRVDGLKRIHRKNRKVQPVSFHTHFSQSLSAKLKASQCARSFKTLNLKKTRAVSKLLSFLNDDN